MIEPVALSLFPPLTSISLFPPLPLPKQPRLNATKVYLWSWGGRAQLWSSIYCSVIDWLKQRSTGCTFLFPTLYSILSREVYVCNNFLFCVSLSLFWGVERGSFVSGPGRPCDCMSHRGLFRTPCQRYTKLDSQLRPRSMVFWQDCHRTSILPSFPSPQGGKVSATTCCMYPYATVTTSYQLGRLVIFHLP